MKKVLLFVLLIITNLLTLTPVQAHLANQPPFLKINGVYSQLYPVATSSLSDFNLPQDQAAQVFIINQPITFLIDSSQLPVPREVVLKTDFCGGTTAWNR